MRFMLGELSPTTFGILSVVLFTALFVGLVMWVFRRSGRQAYARLERLPLDD